MKTDAFDLAVGIARSARQRYDARLLDVDDDGVRFSREGGLWFAQQGYAIAPQTEWEDFG